MQGRLAKSAKSLLASIKRREWIPLIFGFVLATFVFFFEIFILHPKIKEFCKKMTRSYRRMSERIIAYVILLIFFLFIVMFIWLINYILKHYTR